MPKKPHSLPDHVLEKMPPQAIAHLPPHLAPKPDLDIVVANFASSNQLLTNDGSGGFTASTLAGGPRATFGIALGDVDGDGDLDALVANSGQPNQLLTNDGSGNFTASTLSGGSQNSSDIALGDVDGDGDLDALVAN